MLRDHAGPGHGVEKRLEIGKCALADTDKSLTEPTDNQSSLRLNSLSITFCSDAL